MTFPCKLGQFIDAPSIYYIPSLSELQIAYVLRSALAKLKILQKF